MRNYLPPGTPDMIKAGYTRGEDMKLFSLTPKDIPRLDWYVPLLSELRVVTMLGKTVSVMDPSILEG